MSPADAPTRHVIHTLDPAASEADAIVRTLADNAPGAHEVVWVGPDRTLGSGEAARLDPAGRALIERADGVGQGPLRAWGAAALRSCARAGATRDLCATLLAPPPNAIGLPARLALRRAFTHASSIAFHDERIRAAWADRLRMPALADAPVEPATLPGLSGDPAAIRAALGARDDALVLMDVGGPPEQRDAHRLCFTAGVLTLAGVPCHAVAHPRSRGLALAQGYVRHHGDRWGLTVTDDPAWDLLAGVDVALWLIDPWVSARYPTKRSAPTTLALEAALARGVEVIVEDHPLGAAIADGADAPVFPPGNALALNRAIAAIASERAGAPLSFIGV